MVDENVVITHVDPKSPVAEAYRVLRTNVQYSNVDKKIKSIVITSTEPMEGKTTTAVNLAVTFAQAGNRVLLIDSDLRKPRIHKIFMFFNNTGLTKLLAEHGDYREYIRKCDIPNLDILTSGAVPPNPSEMLASESMKRFMLEAINDYDIILLDAPPVGSVTDASIISTFVDGTILVVHSGHTEIDALKRAKEQLEKVNANIIGVVLNKLDKKVMGNTYYYYNYYASDSREKKQRKRRNQRDQWYSEQGTP